MDVELDRLELKISKFLRAGVIVAGTLLAAGWIANVATGGGALAPLAHYASEPLLDDARASLARGDWFRLISYAGLLVLISLPFTRVVLTAVLFLKQREWVLAAVATFVLLALVGSVILGIDL